jgi:hypothetical protein
MRAVRRHQCWRGLVLRRAIVTGCSSQFGNQAENAAGWDAAYKNVVGASGESDAIFLGG